MSPRPALLLSAGLLCAFQAPRLAYDPKHYVNNDPIWDRLNAARITADRDRGVYRASFPPELQRLNGAEVRIAGFVLPLEASSASRHFSLVRRNTGCPFCPPNAPTEAVEVFAQAPVRYTGDEVVVTGRFELVASSEDGLFYRLRQASPAPRSKPQ